MSSELGKYGSTTVVQTFNVGFTSEVSHYLVVHTGPGVADQLAAMKAETPVLVLLISLLLWKQKLLYWCCWSACCYESRNSCTGVADQLAAMKAETPVLVLLISLLLWKQKLLYWYWWSTCYYERRTPVLVLTICVWLGEQTHQPLRPSSTQSRTKEWHKNKDNKVPDPARYQISKQQQQEFKMVCKLPGYHKTHTLSFPGVWEQIHRMHQRLELLMKKRGNF